MINTYYWISDIWITVIQLYYNLEKNGYTIHYYFTSFGISICNFNNKELCLPILHMPYYFIFNFLILIKTLIRKQINIWICMKVIHTQPTRMWPAQSVDPSGFLTSLSCLRRSDKKKKNKYHQLHKGRTLVVYLLPQPHASETRQKRQ